MRGAVAVVAVVVALVGGAVAGAVLTGFGAANVASLRPPTLALSATEPPDVPEDLRRRADAAIAWTGEVFVVVGGVPSEAADPTRAAPAWSFAPDDHAWTELPVPPLTPRSGATAVWTGTEVLVVGGTSVDGPTDGYVTGAAAFDPRTGTWRQVADVPGQRSHLQAVVVEGRVVLAGGEGADAGVVAVQDLAAGTWQLVDVGAPVTDLRVLGDGTVGVVVAAADDPVVTVLRLDPETGEVVASVEVAPPTTSVADRLPGEEPTGPARAALLGDARALLLVVERPGDGTSVYDVTDGPADRVGVVADLRVGGRLAGARQPVLERGGVVVEVGPEPGGRFVGLVAAARHVVQVAAVEGPGPRCGEGVAWAADDAGRALVLAGDCDGALLRLDAVDVPVG